ncbi:MAG: hypothetical protein AMR96_07170 [Candidatus Adiutrix intracellularis]|jgi:oligoendopeptidase F|nr:MAG: hypothetical protein AMR96_07170 [Candidatus Adiutrix intracellularis]MDR2827621.1 M3 family oligoendopeptidase [Candidatus Adiutrix intracellularis]
MNIPLWTLEQLYTLNSPKLSADLARLDEKTAHFTSWRTKIKKALPSPNEFKALLAELEDLNSLAHRLSGFAVLAFTQNTQDQKAQAFMAKIDEKMADLNNELLFFELWWKDLAEETVKPLRQSQPDFAYWLDRTRAFRSHTLTEVEEKIINLKNTTGNNSLIALYDSITNRYRFSTRDITETNVTQVTRDELMVHVRSANQTIRAAAYHELYRVFSADGPVLGQIYQTIVRDWRIENMRLRHYNRPIDVRHKTNNLQPETVEALLNTIRDRISLFGEFFKLKAKALGLAKLNRSDLYAPLIEDKEPLNFQSGLAEVLAAFERFSPIFHNLATKVIDEGHFHGRPQSNKQSGAFCYSIRPVDTPWVLMTYNGRRQDLFTLAHELGHAVHSQLANKHNIFNFQATLPLAETASTFGEILLADHLMKKTQSISKRSNLIFHLLDDAYATIGRQAFFTLFEISAHEMVENGATVDELSECYLENLREQFADNVEIDEEFRWEWVSIPHIFHTPFYVYAYSFGQLLVYNFWRQYEKEGPNFTPHLINLLAKGGSAAPADIIATSGLGPLDEEFWQKGFEVIESLLQELKLIF